MPIGRVTAGQIQTLPEARVIETDKPVAVKSFSGDETKSRRILVQGIVQAVVQSPIVAGLSFATEAEAVALIKRVSTELINFVDNN